MITLVGVLAAVSVLCAIAQGHEAHRRVDAAEALSAARSARRELVEADIAGGVAHHARQQARLDLMFGPGA